MKEEQRATVSCETKFSEFLDDVLISQTHYDGSFFPLLLTSVSAHYWNLLLTSFLKIERFQKTLQALKENLRLCSSFSLFKHQRRSTCLHKLTKSDSSLAEWNISLLLSLRRSGRLRENLSCCPSSPRAQELLPAKRLHSYKSPGNGSRGEQLTNVQPEKNVGSSLWPTLVPQRQRKAKRRSHAWKSTQSVATVLKSQKQALTPPTHSVTHTHS